MNYEQLEVWQRAFKLSVDTYEWFKDCRDYGFKDQICRASVSVPSNIAEGWERFTQQEKFRFISIAKGSCGELKTQLMIAKEINYIPPHQVDVAIAEAEVIGKMLGGLMRSLK